MNWEKDYLPKQIEALNLLGNDTDVEQLLYGGAAGGGKSWFGCRWQTLRRLRYPGTRSVIGRSKLDTLKKTTLKSFFESAQMMGLKANRDYVYNGSSNVITFENESEILLKDLFLYPSDPNFDDLGSLEITDYFIDEAPQVTKKAVDILSSRVRFKLTQYGLKPKGMLSCNPTKGWLYNDFYKASKDGIISPKRAFVQALPGDNIYLPESYYDTLSRLPEQDRKRLRDGDWDYDESIDRIFAYDDLIRCFRGEIIPGEKYITADIARMGKDRTVLCYWEGMTLIEVRMFRRIRVDEVVAEVRKLMTEKGVKLSNVIADEDGVGGGVVDVLKCRGFINGSRSTKPDRFQHLKAECYFKLGELVEAGGITFLCNDLKEAILKELDLIRRRNPDSDGKLNVTGKEEIAKAHGFSPDIADAIMLRMFFAIRPNYGKYSWA